MCMIHGGKLRAAADRYGIDEAEWLDLSTGIAPWSWPLPPLPAAVWSRLPEAGDGLIAAAADYYGCPADRLAALPGSQFAIRELPRLFAPATVAVPAVGYTEHAAAWHAAGHRLRCYADLDALESMLANIDRAVVLDPNNPSGERAVSGRLGRFAAALGPGRLVVDAAFADCAGGLSFDPFANDAIVLRSVGKYFGLAGMRLGFAFGHKPVIEALHGAVEPWGVAHPARWIGARALADRDWQIGQNARIRDGEAWLRARLADVFPGHGIAGAGLFVTVFFPAEGAAAAAHEALARRGVLTRLGDNGRWLRFGLPLKSQRERLSQALTDMGTHALPIKDSN
ncbi:threonine-phosphate decarboxylase CobD [Salinisphaera sp.]|uniref:threonine-phosphate decarboxylase CobD n=1 Tax=Salinisphaera sp. TaxID=1914330 RepID=UPI002D777708|nr:threonine-phosphate decarboxylase CobD [Salinisphaera sp.]HET7314127.1 threonine-phosphate decarboxylase CobD [Salinisphaera sp.]